MKPIRLTLAAAALFAVAGVAYVAQQLQSAGTSMVAAAEAFVGALSGEQKAKAVLPFDSPERFNWNFVPLQDKDKNPTRKGLRLEEMAA